MLKHGPKILDLIKRDFFQFNLPGIKRKLGKNCCRDGLGNVWERLIC